MVPVMVPESGTVIRILNFLREFSGRSSMPSVTF